MKVTPDQIDEIYSVFQKHQKPWSVGDAMLWARDWIEEGNLAECLEDARFHKDRDDGYYAICIDVLRIFYADVMDSPLFKAMEEVTD